VVIEVVGMLRYIYLPDYNQYSTQLTATGNGLLTYTVGSVNSATDSKTPIKTFSNVHPTAGERLTSAVIGGTVRLFVLNAASVQIAAEVLENGSQTTSVEPIPLASIALNKSALTLTKNKTADLTVLYSPLVTTDDPGVIWSSSNPAVATVTDGIVTTLSAGNATITAQVGSLEAYGEITVLAVMLGDVNGDTKINNVDVILINRYLAGWPITLGN
jgi:uncharacterized protein YjdB